LKKPIGAAFGVSVTHNTIANTITAYVDSSKVVSRGDLRIEATSPSAKVWAFSLAAAVAYSAPAGTALSGSISGAISINEISNTIDASIRNTPAKAVATDLAPVRSTAGSIILSATDGSEIVSKAIGVSVAIATGGGTSGSLGIGVSSARNRIDNDVKAYLLNAEIGTALDVSLTSSSTGTINALSVAVSVSVAEGSTSLALSGGGAESVNVVLTDTNAYVQGSTLGISTHRRLAEMLFSPPPTLPRLLPR
jgi:hypothetical protein